MAEFTHPFLQKLTTFKDKQALIYEGKSYSYQTLLEHTKNKLQYLKKIQSGSIIGLIGDYDIDSLSLFLAGIEKRLILTPLTNDNTIDLKLYEAKANLLYQNGIFKTLNTKYEKNPILQNLEKKSGLILFSSGSTGKPKAILHNLDKLLDSYLNKKIKSMYILLFLMFDHIGGLNTLFSTLAIGACGVGIKDRKNIQALAKIIQDYKISLLPASPSLLNLLLLSNVYQAYDLSSLKIITYGTEQMPDSLLNKLRLAFPKVRFHQTFGTTEIGIIQTKTSQNSFKLEGIAYKILDNQLYLKSDTQALGYLNTSKPAFDHKGYFATGDLVETFQKNNEEYIKIIGRIKEVINVGGEKVLPSEIEGVVLEIEGIVDCLVYGESNPITGQSIGLKVVLDSKILDCNDKIGLKKIIRKHCKKYLSNYKIPTKITVVEKLEMTQRFKKIRKSTTYMGGG
ncbi:fatty acid--CoA ligase family protein [Helicobacter sp. 13S00477-4]|uniref:ANL family adenylate-forming protein n=1 Tax=Helicobacter sp. 13S00477-4 TaxID=1905759 RepID=UPI000BA7BD0A|nr:fatty acid--CoA ligase family protein [Helicobacter sp. 13S00477-4]PAF51505.1 AMP-dependent synthetase [Helicobacter sp. 13S00477-4]